MATLTSEIQALLTYANGVTGEGDTTLGEAVHTLADGYGQGSGDDMARGLIDGSLINVVIPNGTTYIREYAFYRTNVVSVVVPNSVNSMGAQTFDVATKLTSLTLNTTSLATLPTKMCDACTALTEIVIPSGVKIIGTSCFQGCTSLANVTIPNTVTNIAQSAFSGCTAIDTLVVPSSVTTIGSGAFKNVKKVVYSGTAIGSPWGAIEVVSE